jgi:hypothetical protein
MRGEIQKVTIRALGPGLPTVRVSTLSVVLCCAPVKAPLRARRDSILDLLRRDNYNPSVSPFRNWIACALVIANSLLYGISDGIENSILKQLVGGGCRFELSFSRNLIAHIWYAGRSTRRL